MHGTWYLVADSAGARLFSVAGKRGPLTELEDIVHTEARQSARDLTSDRPGRTFDSVGQGRHAMETPVDPKQHEAAAFARTLAQRLRSGRVAGDFDRLVIAAPPRFLGLLRESIDDPTRRLVVQEIDKDLLRQPVDRLGDYLSA